MVKKFQRLNHDRTEMLHLGLFGSPVGESPNCAIKAQFVPIR